MIRFVTVLLLLSCGILKAVADCRAPVIADDATVQFLIVKKEVESIPLLDGDGCPENQEQCVMNETLARGDVVLSGEQKGDFVCVTTLGNKKAMFGGSTTGWVTQDSVENVIVQIKPPEAKNWTGRFEKDYGDSVIDIQYIDGNKLAVAGAYKVSRGCGPNMSTSVYYQMNYVKPIIEKGLIAVSSVKKVEVTRSFNFTVGMKGRKKGLDEKSKSWVKINESPYASPDCTIFMRYYKNFLSVKGSKTCGERSGSRDDMTIWYPFEGIWHHNAEETPNPVPDFVKSLFANSDTPQYEANKSNTIK